MKIIATHKPYYDLEENNLNFSMNAVYRFNEDSNARSIVHAMISAMQAEGYFLTTIYTALQDELQNLKEMFELIEKSNKDEDR